MGDREESDSHRKLLFFSGPAPVSISVGHLLRVPEEGFCIRPMLRGVTVLVLVILISFFTHALDGMGKAEKSLCISSD